MKFSMQFLIREKRILAVHSIITGSEIFFILIEPCLKCITLLRHIVLNLDPGLTPLGQCRNCSVLHYSVYFPGF